MAGGVSVSERTLADKLVANKPARPRIFLPVGARGACADVSWGSRKKLRNRHARVPEGDRVQGSLAKTIELGRRVLQLADKLGAAADRPRAPSFRLIAKQLDIPRGASSVWRAAAIYRLAERYPELYDYEHLGVGHLAVLLAMRGPLQLALLRKAERLRWSRRKLETQVRRILDEQARGVDAVAPLLAELEAAPLFAEREAAPDSSSATG